MAQSVHSTSRAVAALASGTVFGIGLAVAGMVDPLKVLAFLDVTGQWDASLLFVLGGAVVVAAIGFALLRRLPAPLFDDHFHASTRKAIDVPLVAGAALFGVGWGLVGYCPGPAIASIGFGNAEALWFVPALLVGAGVQRWQAARAVRQAGAGWPAGSKTPSNSTERG